VRDHRPRFHVSPRAGWLNDPNGPIEWGGRYHVFFQHNPLAAEWSPAVHWGHVSSGDLVTWTEHPPAFGPSPDGPDAGGCWSGCVVDDDGVPTAVYSGLERPSPFGAESVCLARGDAGLERWEKDPRNPVLAGPPPGLDLVAFRDPYVWREEDGWSLVMGAGVRGEGGAALLYRSADLLAWSYEGVLLGRAAELDEPVWTGRAWECPQLFPLGDRHVLLVSVWDEQPCYPVAFVGRYERGRFEPETLARFDVGPDCYAPATMLDGRGRRLAWAWAPEARPPQQDWAGVLTAPRVLTLRDDGALGVAPVPELEALRGERETACDRPLGTFVAETRGTALELAAEIDGQVRLAVGGATVFGWRRPEALELRVLVDRSIVEVFANGTVARTTRIYPDGDVEIELSADGGEALLRRLDVWRLG
jgi:beta-fructofuranosidase